MKVHLRVSGVARFRHELLHHNRSNAFSAQRFQNGDPADFTGRFEPRCTDCVTVLYHCKHMNTLGIHLIPFELGGYLLFLNEYALAHVPDRSLVSRPFGYTKRICWVAHRLKLRLQTRSRRRVPLNIFGALALFCFEPVQAAYQLFGKTGISCRSQFEQGLPRILR